MVANFEDGFHILGELPIEDTTGIGFGISVLVASWLLGSFCYRSQSREKVGEEDAGSNARAIPLVLRRCALIAPWVALLAYCMKSGMVTGARLISPYYPLLLPLLIAGKEHSDLIRRWWWKALALGVYSVA